MMDKPSSVATLLGISVVATMITGVIGLLVAAVAFLNGDRIGAGACLAAAALAFGLVANALNR